MNSTGFSPVPSPPPIVLLSGPPPASLTKTLTLTLTLSFSLLSCLSVSLALLIFGMTLKRSQVNIRTKLVINLLIAELINSTNNSASGVAAMVSGLYAGPLCTMNGFIGQWSVQAADLSTLLIAIVTFLVLKTDSPLAFDIIMHKLDQNFHWILFFVWLYPLLTATIALFVIGYEPTGNWCWIRGEPKPLGPIMRYSLTHVLRIAIFFTIIVLYTILAHHLRKVSSQAYSAAPVSYTSSETSVISGSSIAKKGGETRQERELRRKRRVIRAAILRLIMFPAAYVILWLPGMVNRLFEAAGLDTTYTALAQSSTQLVGFADAALCIWNLRAVLKSSGRQTEEQTSLHA